MYRGIFAVLLLAAWAGPADPAKILGLFGHPGKSHFDVFLPLMKALALRGNQVTVVSFFPQKDIPPEVGSNYTDISLEGLVPVYLNVIDFNIFESNEALMALMPYLNLLQLRTMALEACENVLPSPQIQNLIRSGEKYDLIITELFNTDCFLGVVHKLQAPFITLSSCSFLPWFNARFGNPSNPSYVPNILYGRSDKMTFTERVHNTILEVLSNALHYPLFAVPAQKLAQKYIDPNLPPLEEIARNSSLLLVNTHFSMHRPKPLVPGIIEVGGMHIAQPKPIPQDMVKFIQEAEHGVILFSLGSMLKAETLGEDRRNAFVEAFRSIPQRVIWKFEKDIPNLPENVKIYPWLPQRDILEHPKVRAFIAHGGLLGLTEAVYCGKPILGIPVYGDQHTNIRVAVQSGMAVELPLFEITKERVLDGLNTILSKKYFDNAQSISRIYRDRPSPPLETAIFWTEYVMRHGGAKHLRSTAVDLNFFEYYLIDVSLTLLALLSTICYILYHIVKFVLARIVKQKKIKTN